MSKKQYAFLSELPSKVSDLELDVKLTEDPKITIVTLYANNWVNNTQSVIIPGISANETEQAVYINPVYGTENIEAIGDSNIIAMTQAENSVTFQCETVPTKDVQLYVRWQDIDYVDSSTGEELPDEVIQSIEGVEF